MASVRCMIGEPRNKTVSCIVSPLQKFATRQQNFWKFSNCSSRDGKEMRDLGAFMMFLRED
jgi:hypothetical protein